MTVDSCIRRNVEHLRGRQQSEYDLPWFFLTAVDTNHLDRFIQGLKDAELDAVEGPLPSEDDPLRFTYTENGVFLYMTSDPACRSDQQFTEFLDSLEKRRPLLALNGIIVLESLSPSADMDRRASQLRKRLDALKGIQPEQDLNVYFVMTGLEDIRGYSETLQHVAAESRQQILGWSNLGRGGSQNPNRISIKRESVEVMLENVFRDLDRFRLRVLVSAAPREHSTACALAFPEVLVGRARGSLLTILPILFGNQVPTRSGVLLCGVYFVGSQTLLRELVEQIQRDRKVDLEPPTPVVRWHWLLKASMAFFFIMLSVLVLAHFLTYRD